MIVFPNNNFLTFAENNVSNATWYITKDENNLTGINLVFNYKENDTFTFTAAVLYKIDFSKTLTAQNIKNGEIGTLSFTKIYSGFYDSTIQEQHTALTNAICNKLFGEKQNATRYIFDNGSSSADPQLKGDVSTFTVIEITDTVIQEKSLKISYANSDEGLIANLNDTTKYATYGDAKNVAITGDKLENNDEQFFGKITPLGDKVTSEQLKAVLNAGYREKAIENRLGKTYTGSIYDEAWYVIKSETTGNIISATFAF